MSGTTGLGETWQQALGATSTSIDISSNGVPGFSEAVMTSAYIRPIENQPTTRSLSIDDISISDTEVTINYTYHNSDPNEGVYYGSLDYYPESDPSTYSSVNLGGWLYDGDSASVSVDVDYSGTWWFNVARRTPSGDDVETGWVSVEIYEPPSIYSHGLDGLDEANGVFRVYYNVIEGTAPIEGYEIWACHLSGCVTASDSGGVSESIPVSVPHSGPWEWSVAVYDAAGYSDWKPGSDVTLDSVSESYVSGLVNTGYDPSNDGYTNDEQVTVNWSYYGWDNASQSSFSLEFSDGIQTVPATGGGQTSATVTLPNDGVWSWDLTVTNQYGVEQSGGSGTFVLDTEAPGFASQDPNDDVELAWSGDTLIVSMSLSEKIDDAFLDIPNAYCSVIGGTGVGCFIDDPEQSGAELTILDLAGNQAVGSVTWDWLGNLDDYVFDTRIVYYDDGELMMLDQDAKFCPGPDRDRFIQLSVVRERTVRSDLLLADFNARLHFYHDEANNQVMNSDILAKGESYENGFSLVNEQTGGSPIGVWVPARGNAWAKTTLEASGGLEINVLGSGVGVDTVRFQNTLVIDFLFYPDGDCDPITIPDGWKEVRL